MTTVLPLSAFCTMISLFLRRIFNASNSALGKFFYGLVRIFNSSDDALLVRAKRQILRKTWISRLDLYSITSYQNDLDYPDI